MSTDASEAMVMLEAFRVTELRLLLSNMGKRKSGRKKELLKRVSKLLHNDCSPELLSAVREIHTLRQISRDARRSPNPSPVHIISTPESPVSINPEPQMIKLPFYQTLDTLLPPSALVSTCGGILQRSEFMIHLSADQQVQIQRSRTSPSGSTSVQAVLRICYSESIGIEEDQYPPNIRVLVNHVNCAVQSYSVAVYLVRVVSCQELLVELRSNAVEQVEVCRRRVSEKLCSDPESEIVTTGLQVSLICPLAKVRMCVPCRAGGCAHLQCFDASSYLQMNERKPSWTCPVCHRYAPADALRIDSLLCEVLESSAEDVQEIEYLSGSTWRALRPQKHHKESALLPLKHRNSEPEGSVVVDLTQFSSDDEDTVSTHLKDKCVHFRKSGLFKTSGYKS